jgi:hypothetical protein
MYTPVEDVCHNKRAAAESHLSSTGAELILCGARNLTPTNNPPGPGCRCRTVGNGIVPGLAESASQAVPVGQGFFLCVRRAQLVAREWEGAGPLQQVLQLLVSSGENKDKIQPQVRQHVAHYIAVADATDAREQREGAVSWGALLHPLFSIYRA